ncbi:MAG: DinB family protein [Steroidobacteraceae bacterium]
MNSTTLQALATFPVQLEAHFNLFAKSRWNWTPQSWEGVPSEPLTASEQVCHIRDIEIEGYQVRFQRTLVETEPILASLDTERLAKERQYANSDPIQALAVFREARVKTVDLLSGLGDAQLRRRAIFEGYGSVSLAGLMNYLCSHDQQHLAGLQWLLGKIAGSEHSNG